MKTKVSFILKVAIFALILCGFPIFIINAQNIDNIRATLNRGEEAFDAADYDRAIREFTEGIRLINRALISSNTAQVRNTLDQMLIIAYNLRGIVYWEIDDYDRSLTDLNEAVRLGTKHALTFYVRGRLYSEKEDWDRAIADYTQAIRLDSQNTDAYYHRGVAYYFKGDNNRALTDWEALLRIDPNNANARRNIQIIRNQSGQ
jgi:tetratricopeptide (TPR) repeat protein